MKDTETDYLNKLFTRSSDESEQTETDFPLADVPDGLTDKLYAITEASANSAAAHKSAAVSKLHFFSAWPKMASIAASLLVAVVVFQLYQQQQTLKQLEQAQTDLATALHYLGEANKITRAQVFHSLNTNMKRAAVAPAIEMGREAVLPGLKSEKPETDTPRQLL